MSAAEKTGTWRVRCFQSGTHIVKRDGRHPHFYVYAAPGLSRMETCETLCAWLNGEAPRPGWADDLIRSSEVEAYHPGLNASGVMLPIYATGPCLESSPGRGDWTQDPAFADERARLMDRLCGVDSKETA